MSKTKQREKSETEHLRGEIRSLKSLVRNLRKRVRQLSKKEHLFDDSDEDDDNEYDSVPVMDDLINNCPSCKKGFLTSIDFTHIIIRKCSNCTYSERTRPDGTKTKETEKPETMAHSKTKKS